MFYSQNSDLSVAKEPSSTFMLERNLLGVPIYTLHPKSATTLKEIVYRWKGVSFKMMPSGRTPLPTTEHLKYLNVMLALFADQPESDEKRQGFLSFTLSQIVKLSGKDPTNRGAVKTVKDTILRYAACHLEFSAWNKANGVCDTFHGPIIIRTIKWRSEEGSGVGRYRKLKLVKSNPRNSRQPESFHRLQFHPMVVENINTQYVSVFLSSILRLGLDDKALAIYQHLFSTTVGDAPWVEKSLDELRSALSWNSRPSRFAKFLHKHLDGLAAKDLLTWTPKRSSVLVHFKKIAMGNQFPKK